MSFATIEEALDALRGGRPVLVLDDDPDPGDDWPVYSAD